jgi:hypothetical protein
MNSSLLITPGFWCIVKAGGPLTISQTFTFDAQGNSSSTFIMKFVATGNTDFHPSEILINQAQPCNIFWVVGPLNVFNLNIQNTFYGILLLDVANTFISTTQPFTLYGKLLANRLVTIQNNFTVNDCSCMNQIPTTTTLAPTTTQTPTNTPTPSPEYNECNTYHQTKSVVFNFVCSNSQSCMNHK